MLSFNWIAKRGTIYERTHFGFLILSGCNIRLRLILKFTQFFSPPPSFQEIRNKKEEEERKRRTTTTTIKKIQGLSQPSYIVVKPQNKERAEKTIANNTGLGKVTP